MKLRNIKTTLETLNEAIKYVVFVLTLAVIASIALFFVQCYYVTAEIYTGAFIDILFAIVLLGMTISAKGSVSLRRTTLMIIFGIFNSYGMVNYSLFNHSLVAYPTAVSAVTGVVVIIGLVASILNVIILILRSIFLVQYDLCANQGIDQLNTKNFTSTFNQSIKSLGIALPNLFVYGVIYQGFNCFVNSMLNIMELGALDLQSLIIGVILLFVPFVYFYLSRKYLNTQIKKSLGSAAFFGILTIGSVIAIVVFYFVDPLSYNLYEFIYTIITSVIGLVLSLYLWILNKKKPNAFSDNQQHFE